jgi:glycosyltransferase involved in cell wall biosynthesis/SAM-dependent methyltransferase
VIIPTYRARSFVEQAVASALIQPEVLEVLLIEDGSADGTFEACRLVADRDARVRLLQHAQGAHRGVGVSRNVGIANACGRYIAFLDADDWFLPNRFAQSVPLLDGSPDVDGVYEAVGVSFDTPELQKAWTAEGGGLLVTVRHVVEPDRLLRALLLGNVGSFCTDGIVVRRHVFERTGLFEPLELGQDTVMWWKMAATCRLVPGNTTSPVAVCRRHDACRSARGDQPALESPARAALVALKWAERSGHRDARRLFRAGLARRIRAKALGRSHAHRRLRQAWRLVRYSLSVPDLIFERELWRRPRINRSARPKEAWPPPPSVTGLDYWRARAQTFGPHAVVNLAHDATDFEEITRYEREMLLPALRAELNGKERIVVDLGCGSGRFTAGIAATTGAVTLGIDPIDSFLAMAPRCPAVHYVAAQASQLPLPNASADVVWVRSVLGMITDDGQLALAVHEIERVLVMNGLLFLAENTGPAPDRAHVRFRGIDQYIALFRSIGLRHLKDYLDAGERMSVFAGRRLK